MLIDFWSKNYFFFNATYKMLNNFESLIYNLCFIYWFKNLRELYGNLFDYSRTKQYMTVSKTWIIYYWYLIFHFWRESIDSTLFGLVGCNFVSFLLVNRMSTWVKMHRIEYICFFVLISLLLLRVTLEASIN